MNKQAIFIKLYGFTTMVILLITAIAKLISAAGKEGVLDTIDPIIPIKIRYLLLIVATLEIGASLLLLFNKHLPSTFLFTSILGGQFLLYHLFYISRGYTRGCPCLGTIGGHLPLSQHVLDLTLLLVATWLFIGGLSAFISVIILQSKQRNVVANLA